MTYDPRCVSAVTLLFDRLSGSVVSTGEMVKRIRVTAPDCHQTDEELVELIVSAATLNRVAVQFDHGMETTP